MRGFPFPGATAGDWHGSDRLALGGRIASARLKAGLAQHELARRAGLKATKLNEIERGVGVCPAGVLAELAKALQVPFRDLRGEAPAP